MEHNSGWCFEINPAWIILSTMNQPLDKNRNLWERITLLPFISTSTFTEIAHMALTKNVIVEKLQSELGFPRNKSFEITESLLEIIKASLESGDDVLVSGFGKFCVKEKKQRKGRNPATGEDAVISARRIVTFKCSGKLRDKVNSI